MKINDATPADGEVYKELTPKMGIVIAKMMHPKTSAVHKSLLIHVARELVLASGESIGGVQWEEDATVGLVVEARRQQYLPGFNTP